LRAFRKEQVAMTNTRRILLQVTLPFTLVGFVFLGFSFLGVWSINRLQENRARIISTNVRKLQASLQMEIRLRQFRFHSVLMLIEAAPKRREVAGHDRAQFEEAFATANDLAELPEERRLLEEVSAGFRHYCRELEKVQRTTPSWVALNDVLLWSDAHPVKHLMRPCEDLLQINSGAMEATAQESQSLGRQGRTLFLLMGLLGPVGGLLSGFGAAWGLSRSITRFRIRLRDASAHLDQESGLVSLTGEGSSEQLDRQLEQVVKKIKDVVGRSQQQQRDLIRTEQLASIGQLASSIAHEVRNPLTGIKLLVGAALHQQSPSSLSVEDLEFIHAEIQRLEKKVQTLLDFARPSEPIRERADLRDQIHQALHLVETRIRQIGVRPEIDLPTDPVWVEVDQDQVTGVLVNLFLNALDAMPQGGVLSVSLRQETNEIVRLTVADTGSGISPAVQERLFTPFASTKKTGTGLGLSISRRIVMDHGGTLTGSNRPEGGACFTILLAGKPRGDEDGEVADR
jgi:two-component system, NtrC family, sensor histidine kinase HydH